MKVRSLLALAAIATTPLTGIAAAPSVSAATSVHLMIADMDTADTQTPFFKVICIDGTAIESTVPSIHWPISVEPGIHHLTVYVALHHDCGTEGDVQLDTDFNVGEAPDQTLLIYWPEGPDPQISVFVDDFSCAFAGTARITYRPGAAVPGNANTSLVHEGPVPFVENVEVGSQKSSIVADGVYTFWNAVDAGDGSVEIVGPDRLTVEAGTTTFVYTAGGYDGASWMAVQAPVGCSGPVLDAPQTPTTPVAQPIAVTPLFTG
jgi:hypothetical protein